MNARLTRIVIVFSAVVTLIVAFFKGSLSALMVAALLAFVLLIVARDNVFFLVLGSIGLLLGVLAYTAWTMLNAFRLEFGATSGAILGVERLMSSEAEQNDVNEEVSR